MKKLRDILSLPDEDRNDLYRILNKLVRKQQAEQRERLDLVLRGGARLWTRRRVAKPLV